MNKKQTLYNQRAAMGQELCALLGVPGYEIKTAYLTESGEDDSKSPDCGTRKTVNQTPVQKK